MQQDNSSDLEAVGTILSEVVGVNSNHWDTLLSVLCIFFFVGCNNEHLLTTLHVAIKILMHTRWIHTGRNFTL